MDIQGLSALLRRMEKLAIDVRQVQRPLQAAGALMLNSIEQNFQSQGRPKTWTPLSPRTIAGRRKGRNKKRGPLILIDRARLKNSMSTKVTLAAGDSFVEVGTNVIYARRQNSGYDGGAGRGHAKTPAREFMLFQTEDYDGIERIFNKHITHL